jgi:hypothetical protein
MSANEERESHPSYGMVRFSRRQGSPGRLFGSSLRTHESYVTLSVGPGERIHDNGYDRYHGSLRGELLEVDLSAAQFAELLTTMNVGSGVPCTIRYVNGKKVDGPPEALVEVEKIRVGFKRDMKDLASKCKSDVKAVEDLLQKKSLTKADREEILNRVRKVMTEVSENTPFMLSMFEEATEKVVQHAKAEVDAFAISSVIAEGLRSIAEKAGSGPPLLAAAPADEDPK